MNQFFLRKKAALLIISTFLLFSSLISSRAQAESTEFFGVRRNIATIIFCGLGGAVLGISTLSFYGDPQNHIGNITTGLALGILGGSAYVINRDSQQLDPVTETMNRSSNKFTGSTNRGLGPALLSYTWTF